MLVKKIVTLVFTLAFAGTSPASRLVTLEGDVVEGDVTEVHTEKGVVIAGKRYDFEALRTILPENGLGSTTEAVEGATVLTLVCGSDLYVHDLRLEDEEFSADVPGVGRLTFGIDVVRAIRYGGERTDSRFRKALRELDDSREEDTFFFVQTGELLEKDGLLERIGDEKVVFDPSGAETKVEDVLTSEIYGVVLVSPMDIEEEKRPYKVALKNGTRFHSDWVGLEGDMLKMRIIGDQEVTVAWAEVRGITVHSSRLVFLSDLNPGTVVEDAILALPRPWQRDRSVTGLPLELGEQRFEKGLGLASGMALTFAADECELFVATIGLNAVTGRQGSCDYVLRAGNVELGRQTMNGGDAPRVFKVSVAGRTDVTLAVEPGADLDLSDHADWGDACFLKAD